MALKLGVNETFRDELMSASQRTSIDASALAALIDAEAAKEGGVWQADSFNQSSKAAGLTQFLVGTWIEQAEGTDTLLNEKASALGYIGSDGQVRGKNEDEVLALRFDPLLSIVTAAEYGVSNLRKLKKRGVLPDGATDDDKAKYMYLAHHEGAGGAIGFLSGDKVYTRRNLVGQVGATAADRLIDKAGGDANRAYRAWLQDYIDLKIVPGNFRDGAGGPSLPQGIAPLSGAAAAAPAGAALPLGVAYVTTDNLNLRDAPDGNILASLSVGTQVQVTGAAQGRWQPITVTLSDGFKSGFVSSAYLRAATSPTKEALLRQVFIEWNRFAKGTAREQDQPYAGYIGEMWQAIGQNLDGTNRDVPWSAAFISFVVRNAGAAYANFRFAAAHSVFCNDAINARLLGRTNRPFWGYRIDEQKPELGDIIQRNRGGNAFSFDFAENHANFVSHSDIVIEVREKVVRVMGGNVGDTVSMAGDIQEYELDANGFLKPGQKIIALLKNRADQVA